MRLELLTVREAAAELRLDVSTVYRLVERGELACVRFGRAVRIERSELQRFAAAGRRPAPADEASHLQWLFGARPVGTARSACCRASNVE
jgi:excisionase family DNA binding protein